MERILMTTSYNILQIPSEDELPTSLQGMKLFIQQHG
jgi:hypothetical protein